METADYQWIIFIYDEWDTWQVTHGNDNQLVIYGGENSLCRHSDSGLVNV